MGYPVGEGESAYRIMSDEDRRAAQLAIENKRLAVAWATRAQMEIHRSETLTVRIMGMANPAERAWLELVAARMQRLSLSIFGRQAHHDYSQFVEWMTLRGDTDSRFHFNRMRVVDPPPLEPVSDNILRGAFALAGGQGLAPADYASVFPWYPAKPAFNGMLPADMTEEDKEFITKTYGPEHPIRLPWTVVEVADPWEITRYGEEGDTVTLARHCFAIKWLVRGNGKWYRVTNMAFHPAYCDFFGGIASLLDASMRRSAMTVDGLTHDLHPTFKKYVGVMAETMRSGEFVRLLEADLAQNDGNLFLTFFPHEGYWPDGIKFPWMLEMGIRQPVAGDMPSEEAGIFKGLEERAVEVARRNDLPYTGREIDLSELEKGSVLFWPYRTGGFMRAFHREPLGHDYPKREYRGVKGHRTVILMDSTVATKTASDIIVRELIEASGETVLDLDDIVGFAMWHERTHGTGARPDTPTKSGRTMSSVYRNFWGTIAEPLADAGAVLAIQKRFEAGLIDEGERTRKFKAAIAFQLRRFVKKETAAGPYLGHPEAPHIVGSNMLLGWWLKQGAISLRDDFSSLVLNEGAIATSAGRFFDALTVFSLTDDLDGLRKFVIDAVNSVPDEFERRILAVKAEHIRPPVVNRNPNEEELMTVVL